MSPTLSQLSKGASKAKPYPVSSSTGLQGSPHKKGIMYKIAITSPSKPNSARRTMAKVKLMSNNKSVFAKIPGLGEHRLQNHALVLVSGHGPKDTPGINYHLMRGLCDFHTMELYGRKNRRSKFGVKRGVN